MANYEHPVIPSSLSHLWNDEAQAAHERLAALSRERLLAEMVTAQITSVGSAENIRRFLRVEMPGAAPGEGALWVHSFGYNGFWKPTKYVMAKALHSIGDPERDFMAFTHRDKHLAPLTPNELERLANGDASAITDPQRDFLLERQPDSVLFSGSSSGSLPAAQLALGLAKEGVKVDGVILYDSPNFRYWSSQLELFRAMAIGAGIGALYDMHRAVENTKIPAFKEFMSIAQTTKELARYSLGVRRAEKKAFKRAVTFNGLKVILAQLIELQPDVKIILARGAKSRVTPEVALDVAVEELGAANVQKVSVEGYGHEMGANVLIPALLGKLVLTP